MIEYRKISRGGRRFWKRDWSGSGGGSGWCWGASAWGRSRGDDPREARSRDRHLTASDRWACWRWRCFSGPCCSSAPLELEFRPLFLLLPWIDSLNPSSKRTVFSFFLGFVRSVVQFEGVKERVRFLRNEREREFELLENGDRFATNELLATAISGWVFNWVLMPICFFY